MPSSFPKKVASPTSRWKNEEGGPFQLLARCARERKQLLRRAKGRLFNGPLHALQILQPKKRNGIIPGNETCHISSLNSSPTFLRMLKNASKKQCGIMKPCRSGPLFCHFFIKWPGLGTKPLDLNLVAYKSLLQTHELQRENLWAPRFFYQPPVCNKNPLNQTKKLQSPPFSWFWSLNLGVLCFLVFFFFLSFPAKRGVTGSMLSGRLTTISNLGSLRAFRLPRKSRRDGWEAKSGEAVGTLKTSFQHIKTTV